MNISFGEHKGKSVAEVILKHPDYVKWVLEKNDATGELLTTQNEMIKLIDIFNSKPFTKKCRGNNCVKTSIMCTARKEDYSGLYWWCDKCYHYENVIYTDVHHIIRSYQDALSYVANICKNRKEDYVGLIKRLAEEKGLKKRATKNDIEKFFLPAGILTF